MSGRDPVFTILKCVWKSGFQLGTGLIGIVAIETEMEGYWKAYIGFIPSTDAEGSDEQKIAQWGAKLEKSEAMGFFPGFDPDKFQY